MLNSYKLKVTAKEKEIDETNYPVNMPFNVCEQLKYYTVDRSKPASKYKCNLHECNYTTNGLANMVIHFSSCHQKLLNSFIRSTIP